jgi:hypothetical protein
MMLTLFFNFIGALSEIRMRAEDRIIIFYYEYAIVEKFDILYSVVQIS